jgi:hypothetical protein
MILLISYASMHKVEIRMLFINATLAENIIG